MLLEGDEQKLEKPDKFKLKVLYVEDDTFTNEIVSTMLKRRVEELFVAENGRDGLELYKKNQPDLVITDSTMPYMSGLDMIAEIRKIDKDVIIYMMTAHDEKEFFVKAKETGANGYITKPVDKEKLQNMLKTVIEKKGRGLL